MASNSTLCANSVHTHSLNCTGHMVNNYLRFMLQDYSELELVTKTTDETEAGLTLGAQTITESAVDGDTAAAITLPSATAGTLCVFVFTAQCDGGANITFTCASGDVYQVQTIMTNTQDLGDLTLLPVSVGSLNPGTAGAYGGVQVPTNSAAAEVTSDGADTIFTIAATATNNQTNVGAKLAFYSEVDGKWRVSWQGSEIGSGVINATFAFS